MTHKKTLISVLFIFSVIFLLYMFGITINDTPSMPVGVYIKSKGNIQRGDIVAFCLKEPYLSVGLKRLYLERGNACNNKSVVLIKQVVAVPYDEVVLTDDFMIVNKTRLNYKTKFFDSAGRQIQVYPRGLYKSKGYWMIGISNESSWDSRYFGEIAQDQIKMKLKPLFVF